MYDPTIREPRFHPAGMREGAAVAARILALLIIFLLAGAGSAAYADAQPTFATRVEADFGDSPFYFSTSDWRANSGRQWTNLRSGERKIAANFLVEDADVPVSILFTAEAFVSTPGRRLALRLLVDGQPMSPADVMLASGNSNVRAAQSFEFTGLYDEGIHTVEAQWMTDQGATGFIRQVGLLIRQGDFNHDEGKLLNVTPESGRNIETDQTNWQDVPGLAASIETDGNDDCLTATVSAEAYASSGRSFLMRTLIDGMVAGPGPLRFVHDRGYEGTRSMVFGICDLPAGQHDVQVEWHAEAGGFAGIGDRSLTLSAGPTEVSAPLRQYFESQAVVALAPNNWAVMPGMSRQTVVDANSEITVILSVEFPSVALGDIYARLAVHGVAIPDSEVLLTNEHARPGVHTFIFNAKHVLAGGIATWGPIEIEWQSDEEGQGSEIQARSMTVLVKPQAVPDLAEPPPFGGLIDNAGIEPMRGQHNLLAILWDPDRPAHPAPSIADIEDAIEGPSSSVADYFEAISGGRFTINLVDVLGPYDSDFDWNHYNIGPGDHQDKWVEALDEADADFDFAQYDLDGDGYVHPWHELAIVIVIPQTAADGFVRHLWASDPVDVPQQFDGVDIELITEWYTSSPQNSYTKLTHELGHQILFLGDLYSKSNVAPEVGTRAGRLSLMDFTPSSLSAHLDGPQKLALGWVTPRIVTQTGPQSLEDVKLSHEVLVLPRLPGSTDAEYLVIENRQNAAANTHYDMGLQDSGIAVWHLVEGSAENDTPPVCTNAGTWDTQTDPDDYRQGIRLIRPSVDFSNVNALWSDEHYNLDSLGLICPGGGVAHNVSRWVDGTASYSFFNFSAFGQNMTFTVVAP